VNYKSVADLAEDISDWVSRLPPDLEMVAGIPRSGLLAANLIALYRNIPLGDLEGLLHARTLSSGPRCPSHGPGDFLSKPRRVLVVDDSAGTGTQMQIARQKITDAKLGHHVRYGAVYVTKRAMADVDLFYQIVESRVFEWNLMHHCILKKTCMDIDGVLCRDPSPQENDDGSRYANFLRNVTPNVIPTQEIACLVTCRLEKYRGPTEEWLRRHGVRYRELVMMDFPSKEARIAAGQHAIYKARVYSGRRAAKLFIESSEKQAVAIARVAGKPVWCAESREMINPDAICRSRGKSERVAKFLVMNPRQTLGEIAKRIAGALWARRGR